MYSKFVSKNSYLLCGDTHVEFFKQNPHGKNKNYSKGILKKIHIARSISKIYQVYIFDDPLLYLDKLGKNMVLKLIASLKRAGKTVICFSEDTEIIKLSDKQTNLG